MHDLVSIIIVSWNGKEHLKKCLPSVFRQNYKNIEVILVDNGSIDGSVNYIKNQISKIKNAKQKLEIIENSKNLGFAQANNIGYKVARGNYILFLNNDTRVTPNFLVELLCVFEGDKSIGGVQSKILFMDDPKRLDSVGSFLTSTGFLYHYGVYQKDTPRFNRQIEIFSAKGACMMFRRQVLEKIKANGEIFDSRYFAYFEETDLSHRVWLAGYRIVYVPTSVIYHKYGATSQRLAKPFIEYHSYKNRICSYIKNLGNINLFRILVPHLLFCEILSIIFVFRAKPEIFLAIQRAILWNLLNIKATLKKRKLIQTSLRKASDDIIFPHVFVNAGFGYYFNHLKGWNVTQINIKKS